MRSHIPLGAAAALLAVLCGCSTVPGTPSPQPASPGAGSEGEDLRATVAGLARARTNRGRYGVVRQRLAELGLAPQTRTEAVDWFTFQRNVLVELPGTTPQVIYIVAHYDKTDSTPLMFASLLLNGALDPLASPLTLSSGAKDNATGVAVALELGRALARTTNRFTYRILLAAAEEDGLRGSRAHVARLTPEQHRRIVLAVNIDSVGLTAATNGVTDFGRKDPLVVAALEVAHDLQMPLVAEPLPLAASSDFEPFQEISWWREVGRGLEYNLAGGLLPQRSWFTGKHRAPVLNFSAALDDDAGDYIAGLLLLPTGAFHGFRDRASGVDPTRLHEQYAIIRELLRRIEDGRVLKPRDS